MLFRWLLLLVPISLVLHYALHVAPPWVFLTACLAIAPLAEWVRRATEQLANRVGPGAGGLLTVTFSNVAELLLGLFVLATGDAAAVKAQITGAIVGNSLFGLGLAILAGSWGGRRPHFSRPRAGFQSSLLVLVVIAVLVPALFDYTERGLPDHPALGPLNEALSLGVAVVLLFVYAANLVYAFVTRRDAFEAEPTGSASWSLLAALAVLAAATAAIAFEAELAAGALAATARRLGLTTFFLAVTVLAVVGNAAEYFASVSFARQGRMTLAFGITVGSTIQIALLVVPVLVLASYWLGYPMDLVFSQPLELIAIAAAAVVVVAIAHDGETDWFEGLLLLAVYAILGMAFFFVT